MSVSSKIPDEFMCPITLELMKEPWLCPEDGYTYEKEAIECWVIKNNLSPMTRKPINKANLILNRSLKNAIARFIESNDVKLNSNVITQFKESTDVKLNSNAIKNKINIDELLKVVIKYEDIKTEIVQQRYRPGIGYRRSYTTTLSNNEVIIKINSRLSELKKYLPNFINANEILEQQLNLINNKKNDQSSDNWREDM